MLNKIIKYFLENKLVTILIFEGLVIWGIVTAPFNWNIDFLPRDPVSVDTIPDIGCPKFPIVSEEITQCLQCWSRKRHHMVFDDTINSIDKIEKAIAGVGHNTPHHKATTEVYVKLPGCCKYDLR